MTLTDKSQCGSTIYKDRRSKKKYFFYTLSFLPLAIFMTLWVSQKRGSSHFTYHPPIASMNPNTPQVKVDIFSKVSLKSKKWYTIGYHGFFGTSIENLYKYQIEPYFSVCVKQTDPTFILNLLLYRFIRGSR